MASEARILTESEWFSAPHQDLPGAKMPGTIRTAFHGLQATCFRSTLIAMPDSQCSPDRISEIEHVIVVLSGAFEFTVDGDSFRLDVLDQIYVPIGVHWSYRNVAASESRFLSIVGP